MQGHGASAYQRGSALRTCAEKTERDTVGMRNDPLPANTPTTARPQRWRAAVLGFVFLWFALGGLAHFAFTEAEMRTVPDWIAWPREAVWISGVAELLGAAGLLWRPTRRAAAWGLVLLTAAVTPANVHMLQHAEQFPAVPYWALVARLPLQAVLLGAIGYAADLWPWRKL